MGGEKLTFGLYIKSSYGSPPRGRGKGCRIHSGIKPPRITPAWAGKSRKQQRKNRWKQDHPRMGGEKISTHCSQWSSVGSPPHGRGKAWKPGEKRPDSGITPAWAGKSTPSLPHAHTCEDHPRMGGEKQCGLPTACRRTGSPPHGRGKAVVPVCASRLSGITPAWAGKSQSDQHDRGRLRDHPRMGGEKPSQIRR